MFNWKSMCAFAAGTALMVSQAGAVLFSTTTADGNGADTRIRGGSNADVNYGAATTIVLKDTSNLSFVRKGYVRFDVSGASNPFVDSRLDFEINTNNGGSGNPSSQAFTVNVYGLRNGDSGENWVEGNGGSGNSPAGEIDWNNAPGNVNSNRMGSATVLLGSFDVETSDTPGSIVSFSNPALATFLNQDTDGNATIILQRDENTGGGSANLVLASKENATRDAPALSGNTKGALKTITTADGNGADSYVRLGEADRNFGNTGNVVIKDSNNGSTTRKGYLRFDLSSINSEALQAGLSLDIQTNNGRGVTGREFQTIEVYGLTDESLDDWVEGNGGFGNSPLGEIDWNNAPGNVGGDGVDGSITTLLGSFSVEDNAPGGGVIFSDQRLADFLNTDTNDLATLILRRVGGDSAFNLAFASKEHGSLSAPRLDVVTQIPEPATATLAVLGLAGLARRRRRVDA